MKLNEKQIIHIRTMHKAGLTNRRIARIIHISPGHVSDILTGRRWSSVKKSASRAKPTAKPTVKPTAKPTPKPKKKPRKTKKNSLRGLIDCVNSVEKLYPPPTYIELNDLPREEWEGYTKKAIKALSFSMDSVCEICGNQICTNCHHCPVHGNMDAKTRGIIRVLLDLGMEKSTLDTVFKTANHP